MRGLFLGVVACAAWLAPGAARADHADHAGGGPKAGAHGTFTEAWPAPPPDGGLSLDQKLVERMSDIGNQAGEQIQNLSGNRVALHIDGRHQRAHIRLAAGPRRYLSLQMDEDILFTSGRARIATRIDLVLHGHDLRFGLPDVEMSPTSYQNESGVAIALPLFERRW